MYVCNYHRKLIEQLVAVADLPLVACIRQGNRVDRWRELRSSRTDRQDL